MPTTAVIDSCVLFQYNPSDILLHLAAAGLFEPIWSPAIEEEWTRNLLRFLSPEKVERRREHMSRAFPEASCPPTHADMVAAITICRCDAQLKDAHVTAAALSSGANLIITNNIRDFPPSGLTALGLKRVPPENFVISLIGAPAGASAVADALERHRGNMRTPPRSALEYLCWLGCEIGWSRVAARLAEEEGRIVAR